MTHNDVKFEDYTYEEAYESCLKYFAGDALAASTVVKKYLLKDKQEVFHEKTPLDMHHRLASEFARIEAKYPNPLSKDEIFGMLDEFSELVPQGSPMSGIGNPFQTQSLSNCFFVETGDSYGYICNTDQQLAQIYKRRGGVGTDISDIRPKYLPTSNAARTTEGIVPYMERFSNTTREVGQNSRRGALMISISCHHPQILDFIRVKRDKTKVTGANISVRWSDEFLTAVESDADVELRWPVDSKDPTFSKFVNAKSIWNEFIESNWDSAEPGSMFWDNIIKYSPTTSYAKYGFLSKGTNPCSEIPLCHLDACRLLFVNLTSCVVNAFTEQAYFDWNKFAKLVTAAQRLMDDLVDLEIEAVDKIIAKVQSDPEPEDIKYTELNLWKKTKEKGIQGRRTGLGVTALGDVLAMLGIRYGSDESISLTDQLYKELALNAYRCSITLAQERGPFPIWEWELEKDNAFLNRIWEADPILRELNIKHGRRNIALLTTAPTGTGSLVSRILPGLHGTTSGIEPAYLLEYKRRRKIDPNDTHARVDFKDELGDKWQEYVVYHPGYTAWMSITGKNNIQDSPYYKSTANDIDWMASVMLQSAAQYWVDHSISKTCNVPKDIPKELISEMYLAAWKAGCKGFTIYRDGCRTGVLVKNEDTVDSITYKDAPKRPSELPCVIHHWKVKGQKWTIIVGMLSGRPYEVFAGPADIVDIPPTITDGFLIKHSRKSMNSKYDLRYGDDGSTVLKNIASWFEHNDYGTLSRMVSMSLRHGVPIQFIVEQLQKDLNDDLWSFNNVLARVLKTWITDGTKRSKACTECGQDNLIYEEGCLRCSNCGHSKCG